MHLRAWLTAVAAVLAACEGGVTPAGPQQQQAQLTVSLDQSALTIADTAAGSLRATVRGADGSPRDAAITWTSRAPWIVQVGTNGALSPLTAGRGWVVARAGYGSDSAQVTVTTRFISIHAGSDATCAQATGGRIYCWGSNAEGQLVNGSQNDTLWPASSGGGIAPAAYAFSSGTSCAVNGPGAAVCWGFNAVGQLGDGTQDARATLHFLPESLLIDHLALGAGATSCAAGAAGWYCWGWNRYNQTLDGPSGVIRYTPALIAPRAAYRQVSPGGGHVCALDGLGEAWCWGRNERGQAGGGSIGDHPAPVRAAPGLVFETIAAGETHTCGRTATGAVWCWGDFLGDVTRASPVPSLLFGGVVFDTVAATRTHTCALDAAGSLVCWGPNNHGQLGGAATASFRFRQVSAGYQHTCGITRDGVAYCWGANPRGGLGNGTRRPSADPVRVAFQH